jgi:hypothetical protein
MRTVKTLDESARIKAIWDRKNAEYVYLIQEKDRFLFVSYWRTIATETRWPHCSFDSVERSLVERAQKIYSLRKNPFK